jgi:AraC-like DNA-binding protein
MAGVFQKPAPTYDPRGRLDPAGFLRHAEFRTWRPPDALLPFVEHGWCVRWENVTTPFHNEEVMHRPYVDLFVDRTTAGIQGTFRQRRTYVAEGAGRVLGLRFRPGGFTAIWPGKMVELQGQMLDLGTVFPAVEAGFAERRRGEEDDVAVGHLFAFVQNLEPRDDPRIDLVNDIIGAVEADDSLATVRDVAARYERSERWVQHLFRDCTGVNLKWFLRRVRLLGIARAIRADPDPDWADLAYRFGYASQQHFNTEFKAEIGQTPRQYWRTRGEHPGGKGTS